MEGRRLLVISIWIEVHQGRLVPSVEVGALTAQEAETAKTQEPCARLTFFMEGRRLLVISI